jgi:hypothetical protein
VSSKPIHVRILFAVFVTYLVLAGAYALYSGITHTGLFGWIIDLQFRMFHEAELRITFFLTFFTLILPALPLGAYLKRQGYNIGKRPNQVTAGGQTLVYNQTNNRPPRLSLLVLIGLAPFIISVVVYGYVTVVDANNQSRQIYQMDLSKSADLPATDVKFVELSSTCQQDLKYVVDDKSGMTTRYAYTPLTGPGWTSGQPVKYFLYFKTEGETDTIPGSFNSDTGRYDVAPPRGPYRTTFAGQLSANSLPTYVKNAYERKGIKVADQNYVLTWMGQFGKTGVQSQYSSQMYYLIPLMGGIVSAIVLFVLVLSYITRRKRAL